MLKQTTFDWFLSFWFTRVSHKKRAGRGFPTQSVRNIFVTAHSRNYSSAPRKFRGVHYRSQRRRRRKKKFEWTLISVWCNRKSVLILIHRLRMKRTEQICQSFSLRDKSFKTTERERKKSILHKQKLHFPITVSNNLCFRRRSSTLQYSTTERRVWVEPRFSWVSHADSVFSDLLVLLMTVQQKDGDSALPAIVRVEGDPLQMTVRGAPLSKYTSAVSRLLLLSARWLHSDGFNGQYMSHLAADVNF